MGPCLSVPYDDTVHAVSVPGWFRIQIGNNIPHSTHDIMSIKGINFCKLCGAYGVKKCKLLLHPCSQQCSISSQRARDKLLLAQLLTKLMSWPRTRCQIMQPRAESLVRETSQLVQACATDIPCGLPVHITSPKIVTRSARAGGSTEGHMSGSELCERTREFVSQFDDPELDCILDESDL